VVVVHGAQDGPVLLVDAATHGDEYEGTLALLALLREAQPSALRGTLIGVPVLNGPSYESEMRGNPLERYHYDLNRTFPGERGGSITQRIAARYFGDVVKRANAIVSLHGGGNVFYLDGFVVAHSTAGDDLALIRAMGWPKFTDAPDTALNPYQGTLWDKAAEMGIPSLVAVFGGASRRSPTDIDRAKREFLRGIRNVMIHLGMISGTPDRPKTLAKIKKQNVRAAQGGIIDFEPGIDIDSPVAKGQALMKVYDPVGELVDTVVAPMTGRIMALPGSPLAYPGRILTSVYDVIEEISTAAR
jgi:predicted deacylase